MDDFFLKYKLNFLYRHGIIKKEKYMLDIVQTLAILKLLKEKNNKDSSNSSFGDFIIIILVFIFLPILFCGFPLAYLLIYRPYKFFKKEKTETDEALDNFTFVKYLLAISLCALLLILCLASVLSIEVAFTLFTILFYIFIIINYFLKMYE